MRSTICYCFAHLLQSMSCNTQPQTSVLCDVTEGTDTLLFAVSDLQWPCCYFCYFVITFCYLCPIFWCTIGRYTKKMFFSGELKLSISQKVVNIRLNTFGFRRHLISLRQLCVRDFCTRTDGNDGSGFNMGPLKVTESNIHSSN